MLTDTIQRESPSPIRAMPPKLLEVTRLTNYSYLARTQSAWVLTLNTGLDTGDIKFAAQLAAMAQFVAALRSYVDRDQEAACSTSEVALTSLLEYGKMRLADAGIGHW